MSQIKLKQYLRESAPKYASDVLGNVYHLEGRPRRVGVIVSTGPGKYGFSIISPKEDLDEMLPANKEVSYTQDGKEKQKTVSFSVKKWTGPKVWEFGTNLALERSEGKEKNPTIIPRFIKRQIEQFEHRMERYFKN